MKYYRPGYDELPDDLTEIAHDVDRYPEHSKDTTELVAEFGYAHHDWWECAWPMEIVLVDDAGVESKWSVEREMVPEFHAMRAK